MSALLADLEAQALQWIVTADADFVDLALAEVRAADPAARVSRALAPGVLLVEGGLSFADLAAIWGARPPIFVRHVCPVQSTLRVLPTEDWAERAGLAATAEALPYLDPDLAFSVQSRVLGGLVVKPFDLNQHLAQLGESLLGLTLDVRHPAQVLSVVAVGDEDGWGGGVLYLGASLPAHNLSDWAGGMRRFAREEGQVSRAEFKLLEAIEVFGLEMPARGTALDLGAAPGGWTRVLRAHEQYVTAVDPGELDPRLKEDRGVRHKRMTAEAYLADEPDRFDILVNDMRMDARDSARLMVRYARCLYPHGWALMTMKLPEARRMAMVEHALAILAEAYTVVGARHLFHNRSEITVCLRPKSRVDRV